MAYGEWYPVVGWLVFIVGLVTSIVMFSNTKKLYHVFYVASISLYIFTAAFYIDVFNLAKAGVLAVLVISAVVFMFLGFYFSRVFGEKKR